uniref:mucin-20 n=1 Tax=Myodes glareolus TaxID=447135 RepID=UPI00201FDEBC|nr:mucin-20 [Myodes glareolus]
MGSLWGLTVPLLLFCWKAGVATSSAGLSIGSSAPVVTMNNTEVPAFTHTDRPSSAGAFQTTDLIQYVSLDAQTLSAETASNTLAATSTSSEVNSGDTQTISPAAETGMTQTTCTAASALDIQITSTTASALETQTSSLAAFSIDTQASFPAASSLDTQTTSAPSTLDTQTTSAPSSLDTQATSAPSSPDTQTTSAPSSLDTQTTSAPSSPDTQTTSAASTLDTQTTSPATSTTQTTSAPSSLDTQTTFPTTGTLENQFIFPVELTLNTQSISPVTETRTLAIKMPSDFTVVHPKPTDTSATSGSPKVEMSSAKTGTVSDPVDAIFDTLCTDDSSEETRKITVDLLTLAHTSTEAEHLSSESGSTLDNSGRVLTSPQVLGADTVPPTKDLVAFSITLSKLSTCITEIETPAIIPGTSDTTHSPTGALSTSETLTSPQSPEANPLSPKTTSSAGTLWTTGTSALVTTLEGTLPTSDVKERETTAAQTPTSGGTLVTVSTSPLKETSALSIETQSHTEVLGTITVPRAAGSTMAETISFSGSSTSDSSPSAGATTKGSTTTETLTADDRTGSSFLAGSSSLPFVYSTIPSTSKNANITLAKTTASPGTPVMPSPSTPTTFWTRRTPKHDPGEDGGFLLVRVSVASPEDLTEPKAAEKLMHQLSCELHTHMPLVQVSLLSIRRG